MRNYLAGGLMSSSLSNLLRGACGRCQSGDPGTATARSIERVFPTVELSPLCRRRNGEALPTGGDCCRRLPPSNGCRDVEKTRHWRKRGSRVSRWRPQGGLRLTLQHGTGFPLDQGADE